MGERVLKELTMNACSSWLMISVLFMSLILFILFILFILLLSAEAMGSFFKGGGGESQEEEAEPVLEEAEPVLEGEEFAAAVFALCGESAAAVGGVRDELRMLLMKEQVEDEVRDAGVAHLSAGQCQELRRLQRSLSVRMQLQREGGAGGGGGAWGGGGARGGAGAARVRLQGARRDVAAAAERVRDMAREAEAGQRLRGRVEWQYQHRGTFLPVDRLANLHLETAYENRQAHLRVRIRGAEYEADLASGRVHGDRGEQVALRRIDLKGPK